MAPLDTTSCCARRRVNSGGASVTFKWPEEEPDRTSHTSRLLSNTRYGEFPFQSFIGLCKWAGGGKKRVESIGSMFAMSIKFKDEISNSVQRFSVKEMWKCLAPLQRSPTDTASCLCWGRSCGDDLASGHQAPNLWEIVNTDYLNTTLQANYKLHGTISLQHSHLYVFIDR